ncbi:hypothetical protein EQG49_03430 [Periweissella cryptocerci]|uniref:Uncharacterized protein n=1 Tax=Periweissella cryptocerci TaxID=2506420 RepID=A0A4V1AII0_9LACO|nr:hypothetical protein [Periweissella cryptocerci]QBO35575.1 hypothetical protein EQG49_03430 [Periweissella cryptocerci]
MKPVTKIISLIIGIAALGTVGFVYVNQHNEPSYEIRNPQTPASIAQAKHDRAHPFFIGKTWVGNAKQAYRVDGKTVMNTWTVSLSIKPNGTFRQYADNGFDTSEVVVGKWQIHNDELELRYHKAGYAAAYNYGGKDLQQAKPYQGYAIKINEHTGARLDAPGAKQTKLPDFDIRANVLDKQMYLQGANNAKREGMSESDGQAVASLSYYKKAITRQINKQVKQTIKTMTDTQALSAALIGYRDNTKANKHIVAKLESEINSKQKLVVTKKDDTWLIALDDKDKHPFLAVKRDVNNFAYAPVHVQKKKKKVVLKVGEFSNQVKFDLAKFIPTYILQESDNQAHLDDYRQVQKLIKLK